jgi:Contractile injection system tube protein
MERVALLIETTGDRLGCLLNPESVVTRRHAGVQPRRSAGGKLTGAALADDPLLYTGGGHTELLLDLLFDVTVAGSTIVSDDVRDLTSPLWNLTENGAAGNGYGRPPLVRFVWGKSWNIPGVVTAVAERLEQFTSTGTPHRSWLRLRFLRVGEAEAAADASGARALALAKAQAGPQLGEDQVAIHRVLGAGDGLAGERLEDIAFLYYGDPSAWRVIAAFNGIDDPARVPAGTLLRIPPQSLAVGA